MKSVERSVASLVLLIWPALPLAAQQLSTSQNLFPAVTSTASVSAPLEVTPLVNPAPAPASTSSSPISAWPRPYAFGGLALTSGGGYSPAAGTVGGGLDLDTPRVLGLAEASLENAHKLDSGTGTELHVLARAFLRTGQGWYFGGGTQWSRLSTILYAKQAWRPTFGGGKDFARESFSGRVQAVYVLPGTDHLNAVQGPEISLWLPSPASKHHFFLRETVGIYEFHQTSVPGNPGTNVRSVTNASQSMILYRF